MENTNENSAVVNENKTENAVIAENQADLAQKQTLLNTISLYEKKLANGRSSLLILILFTLVNIVLLLVESGTMFLFSFEIPRDIVDIGLKLSEEYLNITFLGISLAVAGLFLGFMFLLYIFSKKRLWAGITALTFFALDTLALIYLVITFDLENLSGYMLNFIFHIWALVSLISLVRYLPKLKEEKAKYFKLYPEEAVNKEINTIKFFDDNPEMILQIRNMDHESKEYKKAIRDLRISIKEIFPRSKCYLENNEEEKKFRKKIFGNIIGMVTSAVLIFVILFVAVAVFPDDLSVLTSAQTIGFIIFIAVEVLSVVSLFVFLYKYVKVIGKYFAFVVDNYKLK